MDLKTVVTGGRCAEARCLLISLNLMIVDGSGLYYGKVEGYNRTCNVPQGKRKTGVLRVGFEPTQSVTTRTLFHTMFRRSPLKKTWVWPLRPLGHPSSSRNVKSNIINLMALWKVFCRRRTPGCRRAWLRAWWYPVTHVWLLLWAFKNGPGHDTIWTCTLLCDTRPPHYQPK